MSWLSDTWREITSGGKARTQTYNRPRSEPRRTSSSQRSGGGGGGGRVATSVSRSPVTTPPSFQEAREEWGRPSGTGRSAQERRAGDQVVRGARTAVQTAQRVVEAPRRAEQAATLQSVAQRPSLTDWRQQQSMTLQQRVAAQQPVLQGQEQPEAAPRRGSTAELFNRPYNPPTRVNFREMSDEDFLALNPAQRAAVRYNTALEDADNADRAAGPGVSTAKQELLSSIGMADVDVDAFLRLDRAISDSVLRQLGNVAPAPDMAQPTVANERLKDAQAISNAAAATLGTRGANGYLGLTGEQQAPGFSNSADDGVLRQAYDFMVDSQYDPMSGDEIAQGLADLNAANGTSVTPQQLWDFAKIQLDAADFGALSNAEVRVPTSDPNITPLSVAEIRARYGI